MAQQTPNTSQQEPFIPPRYLLGLSAIGFIIALVVELTQPEFSVIGYGGLAFGILALLLWVLLAPQDAKAAFTGRTARFGGTSLLVTILLLVVLIGIYVVVRNMKLTRDLTESDTFSLSDESRKAVAGLAIDPKAPKIEIIGFYGPSQAGSRDQMTLLLDDYKKTSNGKIDYEFVDPERNPQVATLYNVSTAGSIVVAKIDDTTGQPDSKDAQIINTTGQEDLTNAILKVSASGVFNAYFLTVTDGTASQMSIMKTNLSSRYGWTTKDVSLVQLGNSGGDINLDDPNVTGQVIIVPGGSAPITDSELKVLQDYVAKGGDLVILAGTNLNTDKTSLATSDNLNAWLMQDFGISFNKDVVLDKSQDFQTPLLPVATTLDSSSYVTGNGIPAGQSALIFEAPNSINVAATPPANVTVKSLVRSSSASYSKSNLQDILDQKIDKADSDPAGPFVLGASAENSQTKARIVLFGSTAVGNDNYAALQNSGVDNLSVAFNSLIWETGFNDYFTQITVQQQQRPQDQPLFADDQTLRNIEFITIWVLPFGVLLIGVFVWWSSRERAR